MALVPNRLASSCVNGVIPAAVSTQSSLTTEGWRGCAGNVASVDDEKATITDSVVELRIPYASAGDCAVVTLAEHQRSVTLTWHNGTNAFIATRDLPDDLAKE